MDPDFLKQQGFKSVEEFNHLIAQVDTSTSEKYNRLQNWRVNDGSKAGLERVIEENKR
jgi:predicted KAP-like P-loop ATPase